MTRIVPATVVVLLVPLVAMQITDQVDWGLGDFVVAAVLLVGAGVSYELLARRRGDVRYRAVVAGVVGATLLLVWATLAVGLPSP